jgi:NifU-like protein involved in Fe-S cluster formation
MSLLAKGRTIDDALQLQPEDVVKELEGLPDDHMHCARLAINTLGEAIADYYLGEASGDGFKAAVPPKKGKGLSHADF